MIKNILQEKDSYIFSAFVPGIDDKSNNPFLPIPIEEAIKNGIKVPLLIGYNNREGIIAHSQI